MKGFNREKRIKDTDCSRLAGFDRIQDMDARATLFLVLEGIILGMGLAAVIETAFWAFKISASLRWLLAGALSVAAALITNQVSPHLLYALSLLVAMMLVFWTSLPSRVHR